MSVLNRRSLMAGLTAFPAIARAASLPAGRVAGTVRDIDHVVILTQENRGFDHYFGTLNGVQGFGDRFVIPAPDLKGRKGGTAFVQPSAARPGDLIAPFRADTKTSFDLMRLEGTPHTFPDAQAAWDEGRISDWPAAKHDHAMAYFAGEDIPFQFALANAFTLCDAYHCALHAGTNPNRLFLFTGTNDPFGKGRGPGITNAYDNLKGDEFGHGGYEWTTYPERLQAAGISWQVYQVQGDNFDDNPLEGFKTFRSAFKAADHPLKQRGLSTRHLDQLKADVLARRLPQVSYIVAPDRFSEHPGPSSPAQGAHYTAQVLEALTADPEVWARTVLFINYDENDGYFDHVPPPAPPSLDRDGRALGASQIDTAGEYHLPKGNTFTNRPYGLGPRVPLFVISPFSRGGYVASEVFDHTSIIRFLEVRFGVMEPNISPWRRAVCGDLISCFDFKGPNAAAPALPDTRADADRVRAHFAWTRPAAPKALEAPVQSAGPRRRRPTPYRLEAVSTPEAVVFTNDSAVAAVFQVYDLDRLSEPPRRNTAISLSLVPTASIAASPGPPRRCAGRSRRRA
jgi:phospholipase C